MSLSGDAFLALGHAEGCDCAACQVIELFQFLEQFNPCNFEIERNPHASNYETLEQWRASQFGGKLHDVLPGEWERVLATGSLWTVQVYPTTPVGFYAYAASTLEALLRKLKEEG